MCPMVWIGVDFGAETAKSIINFTHTLSHVSLTMFLCNGGHGIKSNILYGGFYTCSWPGNVTTYHISYINDNTIIFESDEINLH